MDYEFIKMMIQIVIFLPFILFLVYVSLRFGGGKVQSIQNGKYIKVLEKVNVSKEGNIILVKIGEEYHIMTSTNKEIKEIAVLSKEEALKYEVDKKLSDDQFKEYRKKFKRRIKKGRFKDE
ncbi:flagellar biosynthetic protein FliO [Clostridium algidicarnis]|uniref:flagellar biosynthetic protein FliO n=1 Tax=Clostridium algidicarnis TaxID=37659 RepID=UPI003FD6F791